MSRTDEPTGTTKDRTVDVRTCLAEIDVLIRRTWSSTMQEAGGQLEIESELGVGTTATLRLPVSEREPQAQNFPPLSSEIGAKPRQPPLAARVPR